MPTNASSPQTSRSDDDQRKKLIVDTLVDAFSDLMDADPDGFRVKFRKMAADPFAFYRGSAVPLLRRHGRPGRPLGGRADPSRVWIQGDLHAENFGTYMDGEGALVFDVNDFDEAYLGPFTWDLRRFVASLALMCWQKALPDAAIDDLCEPLPAGVRRAGALLRRERRRPRLGAAPGHHRGRGARGAAAGALSTRIDLLER